MRFLSALFAVASLPLIAALGNRLAGRGPALAATALAAASWLLLFHGIYARMYSLFLFLSVLSYLALLRALDRGGVLPWTLWGAAMLLCIASHQYGALVLGSQGLYVLLTRARLRQAIPAFAAVFVLAIPLWRSSLVLANRFDVGVGGGGGSCAPRGGLPLPLARRRRLVRGLRGRARDRAAGRARRPAHARQGAAEERAPHRLRGADADAVLPRRALRRQHRPRVTAPDLRAALPGGRGRRRDRRRRARGSGRSGRGWPRSR